MSAHQPAQHQANGDARQGQGHGLIPDDPPQLPGCGADGFQQPVEPDVPGHGDLEHVVDNEVAGKDDQQGHRGDSDDRHGVHTVGQPGAGIPPVDAGVNVVVPGGLALVAVVGQNLIQVLLDVAGTAFQHHVQVPTAHHAVAAGRGDANLVQYRLQPALRDQDVVGRNGFIIHPPARQSKGLGGLMAVHIKRDGELRPDLRLHPQQVQHMGVGGGLIGALPGQAALNRVAVHPVGLVFVAPTHLNMGFVEGNFRGHAQETPDAPGVDQGIVFQFIDLLLRQVFEAAVGVSAHLAEVGLLDALVDGQGDGKEGGKQHCRQGDGRHRHHVPGPVGAKTPPGQAADALSIGYFHGSHPLSAPRSGRPRCG